MKTVKTKSHCVQECRWSGTLGFYWCLHSSLTPTRLWNVCRQWASKKTVIMLLGFSVSTSILRCVFLIILIIYPVAATHRLAFGHLLHISPSTQAGAQSVCSCKPWFSFTHKQHMSYRVTIPCPFPPELSSLGKNQPALDRIAPIPENIRRGAFSHCLLLFSGLRRR